MPWIRFATNGPTVLAMLIVPGSTPDRATMKPITVPTGRGRQWVSLVVDECDLVREFEPHHLRFDRALSLSCAQFGQVFRPGMPIFRSFNSSLVRQNFVPRAISPIRKTRMMPKVMRKVAPSNIPSRQPSI